MPWAQVDADATAVGGAEHWSDLQTVALCMAWYHVSANPADKGTSQTRELLFEKVLVAYHYFFSDLGGVPAKPKKGVPFKTRTGKACKNKWGTMNTCVMKFLACDNLATHTIRKSGATPKEFRTDARKYYEKRHKAVFKYESAYDYLKDKPKWLRDYSQHNKADGKKKRRSTPGDTNEKLRASDSEEEVVAPKGPGQKKSRRLEKEMVVVAASLKEKEASMSMDIQKFLERASMKRMTLQVEVDRQRVKQEELDDEVMKMDMSVSVEFSEQYWEHRVTEIYERQAERGVAKVAEIVAEAARRHAAVVADQEVERVRQEEAGRVVVEVRAADPISEDGGHEVDMEEGEEDVIEPTVDGVVDLTDDGDMAGHVYVNDAEEVARFKKMCENMANAIDIEKGAEEISQPWLVPEVENTRERTLEGSDTD